MHLRQFIALAVVVLAAFGIISCGTKSAQRQQSSTPETRQAPKTLAVLPFENNSVTDPAQYDPLSKGLAAMLITDLKREGAGLDIIERAKIQAILQEISLGQSGMVDPATAIKAGHLLGAQAIAFGSFTVLGSQVRMDTRIVKVETSEILLAEAITGQSADFLGLEQELAAMIAASLNARLEGMRAREGSLAAAVLFSRGVEALDSGDRTRAEELFRECLARDKAYEEQITALGVNL